MRPERDRPRRREAHPVALDGDRREAPPDEALRGRLHVPGRRWQRCERRGAGPLRTRGWSGTQLRERRPAGVPIRVQRPSGQYPGARRAGRSGCGARDVVLYRQLSVLQIADLGGGSSTNEDFYNGKELTESYGLKESPRQGPPPPHESVRRAPPTRAGLCRPRRRGTRCSHRATPAAQTPPGLWRAR